MTTQHGSWAVTSMTGARVIAGAGEGAGFVVVGAAASTGGCSASLVWPALAGVAGGLRLHHDLAVAALAPLDAQGELAVAKRG